MRWQANGETHQFQCEACVRSAAYVGKTINTIQERFYGSNGYLNPTTKASALLEHLHLAHDLSPQCKFNSANIQMQNACNNDIRLRYAESTHKYFASLLLLYFSQKQLLQNITRAL